MVSDDGEDDDDEQDDDDELASNIGPSTWQTSLGSAWGWIQDVVGGSDRWDDDDANSAVGVRG
jgi:hypothetical protein